MLDSRLAHAPAEQHHLVVEAAGKIEQPGIEILHLNADGIDLGDALADALQVGFHLHALFSRDANIYFHSAGEIDAPGQLREAGFGLFRGLLAFDRAFQQRFQHREQGLRFVESEGLHGEMPLFQGYANCEPPPAAQARVRQI